MTVIRHELLRTIDDAVSALALALDDREDIIATTSFGYQSALLFFLLDAAKIKFRTIYISSALSVGGQEKQRNILDSLFSINLTHEDRQEWLSEVLAGRDFMGLEESERVSICRDLKREPLRQFIDESKANIWISGVRRDQTAHRKSLQFIEMTDFGVLRVAPMYKWSRVDASSILKFTGLPKNTDYIDYCKHNSHSECGLHL